MSPEDLAEANGSITARLAEDMSSLALLVENSLVSVIADDAVFVAAQRLEEALCVMVGAAERQRALARADARPA